MVIAKADDFFFFQSFTIRSMRESEVILSLLQKMLPEEQITRSVSQMGQGRNELQR